MKIYLVGGAVRDRLLNLPVKDKDWVVVGANVEQMLALGYQQVGKDFPVFLHPETKDEYALARTERKLSLGYTGFACYAEPNVTLEQDLLRRDLTINAMAEDENQQIFDPYHGQNDLKNKILRHVSEAFSEDPLRVLRVARFAARYAHLGFTIHPSTLALMKALAASAELQSLSAERIWQETAKALLEKSPEVYFESLRECGALAVLFPEIDCLWGVPNPPQWHPEIDTGVHTILVLKQAVKRSPLLTTRFAALCHDLGKGVTPSEHWPSHHGHEKRGISIIETLCKRLKAPNDCRELAVLVSEFHLHSHKAFELKPCTILKMFNRLDVWRKAERFEQFLTCCESDFKGRTGFENKAYPQTGYLKNCYQQAQQVDVQAIIRSGVKGAEIKSALDKERIAVIEQVKRQSSQ